MLLILKCMFFLKKAFGRNRVNLSYAFIHSLMNDIDMIYSCQAHLPVQYASNIELIC